MRKFLCVVLTMIMCLSSLSVAALDANAMDIVVKSVEVNYGDTETTVVIEIPDNPGIALIGFNVNYNKNAMTLKSAIQGKIFTGELECNIDAVPFVFNVYSGSANKTESGDLVTLVFELADDCNAGTYDITIDNVEVLNIDEDSVDYAVTNGYVKVKTKSFTGLSFMDATYNYDGTAKALAVSGVPQGATVTYKSEDFDADGKAINAGTYNITATVTQAGYETWEKTAVLTINPKTVSVTGLTVANKVYDGTNEATLSGGTISGIVARDSADQYCDEHQGYRIKYYIPEFGTFTDANVGTGKSVSIDNIELTGCSADNYVLTQPTGLKANITKAPITVKAKDVTIKTGAAIPTFDENSYEITSGKLFGSDKITGALATDCKSTSVAKDFNITQGTLTAGNNYNLTFVAGKLSVVDKTPQVITVADIDAKTYGAESFKLEVTPDATSKLDTFTYASSNVDVADIAADGTVTIKGAGETTITVSQAGNEEYALAEKSVKLVVNPITVTVTAIDMDNKTATLEGILEADVAGVELDFDNIKTTVISSEKSTIEETTTITSTLKVTNFTLKGEKAKNYATDKTAFLTTTVATTVAEKLTEDENVTIEAASVNDKTIIVTDVAVAPEAEVKKVTIDVTAIADTKVNTVALPKTTVDAIVGIDPETALEITLKDGSAENKESTIILNAQALAAIQTAGASATTISISVDKTEKEELATEQAAKVDEVSTKTPVVYSLSIVDEAGNSVAGSFGDAGKATVTLPYAKPAGNGNVIVKYLDDLGNLTNISNPKYDATTQTVTVELGHFSEYLIYTEPVVSYGGGGGVSRYTVKFETNGGSTVKSVTVNKNAVVTEPTAPTKDGYIFEGWYTDKDLTTVYDFTAKVTKSFTLYAKWTEIEKDPETEEPDTSMVFTDVKATDWFYANVQYVVENKLMNGVGNDKFAPNDTLTRAMLVTVLYRNAGEPTTNRSIPFADVDMGAYYANAVSWAKQNGIVNGVTENEFAPDSNITREQIAAIMFRYAQYKGMDAVTLEENLHFTDADEISEYAVSAMNWAVGTGLMKGKSATTINPKDNATRAEIAAILQRFIEANK